MTGVIAALASLLLFPAYKMHVFAKSIVSKKDSVEGGRS
jgi:hypothetical protein